MQTFKEDILGSVHLVKLNDDTLAICRNYHNSALLLRPLAYWLARREKQILLQLKGVAPQQIPQLIGFGNGVLLRSFINGQSLKNAPSAEALFYTRALQLTQQLHEAGVVHNDLEKPENWVMIDSVTPGIIDFQIAMRLRTGKLFIMLVHEDIRHVIKQKKRYCSEPLSEQEQQLLETRSALGQWWKKYFKPAYNFVTRRILHYSDAAHSKHSR